MPSLVFGKRTASERPTPDPQDDNVFAKRAKPLCPSHSFADVLKEMPINETSLRGPTNTINVDDALVFQYVDIQLHDHNRDIALVFGVTEGGARVLVHVTHLSTLPERPLAPLQNLMFHYEITAMSWMEIPASSFEVVDARDMVSYNQVEVVVRHEDMLFHPPEGQWDRSAPLRILSFDIQAMVPPTPHRMPRYEHEGVLQIGNMLQIRGASHPYSRCIFTLDTCTEIAGAEVKSYETEEDLLLAWRDFVIAADPDLITGHEIACFDIPQLILRTWILELAEFPHLGRLKDIATTTVPQPFNYRKMKDAPVLPGRLQLDIWQYMVESKQSRTIRTGTGKPRCDLKTLAKEFFREKREDIVFTMIPALQLAGPDERQQLALHRLEDTHLPLKILQCPELRCLDESIEAARSSEEYMYCPFREFLRNGRN